MKKLILLIITVLVCVSCEHAFPNDKLDNYWRLRTIEYVHGDTVTVENAMFGFARHIVLVEDNYHSFSRHGVTTDTGDSLKLDFSMYPDTAKVLVGLKRVGIDSTVVTFGVKYPKNKLELSNSYVTLHLERW